MIFNFYDIESLSNVFTVANYIPHENRLDVFYLVDDQALIAGEDVEAEFTKYVHLRNKNFTGDVKAYDLHVFSNCELLAKTFGASDLKSGFTDPKVVDSCHNKYRLVCDTDLPTDTGVFRMYYDLHPEKKYDENKHPYLMGYNSYNYDTTMLAYFFFFCFYRTKVNGVAAIPKAIHMRKFNDKLFSVYKDEMPKGLCFDEYGHTDPRSKASCIRKNMLLSGRHLDVARLNEKQQKVGLKRLLGTLGYQILESDKLTTNADHIDTFEEFCELVAYNASDVINLDLLFQHDLYQAQFSLKKGLLNTYPQLIYKEKIGPDGKGTYQADERPESVRFDRLTIDCTSAQFATKCLCPYGHLSDLPVVSFVYPSERKAKELGMKQVNVLEETKKFFYKNFEQPEIRAQFDQIYNYYKSLEGKNFNDSKNYQQDHGYERVAIKVRDIPKVECCIPYYYKDGTPSSCFALFSVGGIHGAEYNKELYDADVREYEKLMADLEYVKSVYPDAKVLRKAKKVQLKDGTWVEAKNFLKSAKAEYKTYKKPELFSKVDDGGTELNKKYVYTSCVVTNHEDFTSYYPNMLRMMSAFWNPGLGYDRYAEIFDNKQKYGKLMKDKSKTAEERAFYSVMREGTKLILNSASGAADTNYGSPIQMNNRIISMRIIGQLFSYRIAQAQTLAGAKIVSTNTDGLYSTDIEDELNNTILANESADIGVAIEPEPMYLVSKDANNRMELSRDLKTLFSAAGGSLACHKGPNPAKALSHPAITDWVLVKYLRLCADPASGVSISKPFDKDVGEELLRGAYDEFKAADPENADFHWLNMFQTMIASSPGTNTYNYAKKSADPDDTSEPIILPHYNRVFIMDDDVENMDVLHIRAAYMPKVNSATWKRRIDENPNGFHAEVESEAEYVLNANGVRTARERLEGENRDVLTRKITGIDFEWNVLLLNRSLKELTHEEATDIRTNINMDCYVDMAAKSFENSWQNILDDPADRVQYTMAPAPVQELTLF